jgi:hypothetical protein
MATGTIPGSATADDVKRARSPRIERVVADLVAAGAGEGASAEAKVLRALADPENYGIPYKQLAARAGVSEDTYLRLRQNPDFVRKSRYALQDGVGDLSGPMAACRESASARDGRHSAADRRTLFEMAGRIGSRQEPTSQTNIQINLEQRLGLTPHSQILWLYLRLNFPQERWLPGVRDAYLYGNLKPEQPPLPRIGTPEEGAIDVDAVQELGPPDATVQGVMTPEEREKVMEFVEVLAGIRDEFPEKFRGAIDTLLRLFWGKASN